MIHNNPYRPLPNNAVESTDTGVPQKESKPAQNTYQTITKSTSAEPSTRESASTLSKLNNRLARQILSDKDMPNSEKLAELIKLGNMTVLGQFFQRTDMSKREILDELVKLGDRAALREFFKHASWEIELDRAVNAGNLDVVKALIELPSSDSQITRTTSSRGLVNAVAEKKSKLVDILLSNPDKLRCLSLDEALEIAKKFNKTEIQKIEIALSKVEIPIIGVDKHRESQRDTASLSDRCKALGVDAQPSLPDLEGKCLWKGEMSPTLDVYRLRDQPVAVLLWNKGPKKGQVFDVIEIKSTENSPSANQLLRKIDQKLRELDELAAKDDNSKGEKERALIDGLIESYFVGVNGQPALREARFNDQELNRLLSEMDSMGIPQWLKNRSQSLGLSRIEKDCFNSNIGQCRIFGSNRGDPSDFVDAALSHGSYGSIIDSVINAGALLCDLDRRLVGLVKLAGESGRVDHSHTGTHVSFWDLEKRNSRREKSAPSTGHSSFSGFDFPIAFVVNKDSAALAEKENGSSESASFAPIPGEKTFAGSLSLNLVDKVLVPAWAVKDVQQKFDQHGWGHIHVVSTLPLPPSKN